MVNNIFIDPLNRNISHLKFNTKAIMKMQRQVGEGGGMLISEKSLYDSIRIALPDLGANVVNESEPSLRILKVFFKLLGSKRKGDNLVFLCIDNSVLPFLLIVFFRYIRGHNIRIYIHNNIDTLISNQFKRWLHKVMLKLIKPDVILLTQKMRLEYHKLFRYERALLEPHFNYSDLIGLRNYKKVLLPLGKINISVVGRQAKLLVNDLNQIITKRYENLQINLFGVRQLEKIDNVVAYEAKLLESEYFAIIQHSEFILFADDKTSLNRASGVLMDAISLKTPFISPDYGHYMEYRNFGIGLFYKNYEHLISILDKIDTGEIRSIDFMKFEDALNYSK